MGLVNGILAQMFRKEQITKQEEAENRAWIYEKVKADYKSEKINEALEKDAVYVGAMQMSKDSESRAGTIGDEIKGLESKLKETTDKDEKKKIEAKIEEKKKDKKALEDQMNQFFHQAEERKEKVSEEVSNNLENIPEEERKMYHNVSIMADIEYRHGQMKQKIEEKLENF